MISRFLRRLHRRGVLAGPVFLTVAVSAATPLLEKMDLFQAGQDGHALYRIPGIVVTARGTLLAYCEARRTGKSDWDAIDVMLRRSRDGGKSWEACQHIAHLGATLPKNPVALAQKLVNVDGQTVNNPAAITDNDGAVHFLYCVEYAHCFYTRSNDDGKTFSPPVEITATFEKFRPEYDWKVIATGPGHGIQLKNGRLVLPVWMSTGTGGHAHRPSVTTVIYSDDHGQTWQRGEIAAPNTPENINPNETAVVQLADGRVMLNIRSESKAHRRLITTSRDGATGWTRPEFHEQLLEPICMGSTVRFSEAPAAPRNRLLFANPDTLEPNPGKPAAAGVSRVRKNLSVKLSYDEGKTWPVNQPLEAGLSGYSDLATGPDGTIYCLYERASADGKSIYATGFLTLARFNLEWLTDGKDSLP